MNINDANQSEAALKNLDAVDHYLYDFHTYMSFHCDSNV